MYKGHVSAMLYVSDLKLSVDYYRNRLGFGFNGYWDHVNEQITDDYEEAGEPGYASVEVGKSKIGLHIDPEFEPGHNRFELHVEVAPSARQKNKTPGFCADPSAPSAPSAPHHPPDRRTKPQDSAPIPGSTRPFGALFRRKRSSFWAKSSPNSRQ